MPCNSRLYASSCKAVLLKLLTTDPCFKNGKTLTPPTFPLQSNQISDLYFFPFVPRRPTPRITEISLRGTVAVDSVSRRAQRRVQVNLLTTHKDESEMEEEVPGFNQRST